MSQKPSPTALSLPSSPLQSPSRRTKRLPHPAPVLAPRQTISNQSAIDAAKEECELLSGNSITTCWPTQDTIVAQHETTELVWNSRIPQFSQFGLVDIFLFRADLPATKPLLHFTNVTSTQFIAGSIPVTVNDTWFGTQGADWSGQNISYPVYFAIIPSGANVNTASAQSTFTAVQTTFADSVLATRTASIQSTAISSSSSAASTTSGSVPFTSSVTLSDGSPRPTSSTGLQNGSSTSSFPHWAIAVIVVLGFLAIVAFLALLFFISRAVRRRRENSPSRRGSMGSQSPMMANVRSGEATSPTVPTGGASLLPPPGRAASFVSPDGASTASDGLLTGAEAAVMAEAFRQALRKPDFADRPVEEGEGESPDGNHEDRQVGLLNRELAEEGHDIRNVASPRGVRVETIADETEPATENQHLLP